MPGFRTDIGQLLLYDPDKSRSIVHSYSSRPTPLEERTMGRLLFVVEIESTDPSYQSLIQDLGRVLTAEYYGSENFHVEAAFERALQKANEHLHGIVGEELESLLSKLNICIAVVKDSTLHFTVLGRIHAFLIHGQQIIDVLETSNGAPPETPTPLKVFTNIISGQLSSNDTLLLCTTSLLDHLSQEKLKRLILNRQPSDGVKELEHLLVDVEGTSSFAAILIQLAAATEEAPPAESREYGKFPAPAKTQDSMERLIEREQTTNTLLTHSLWPNLGRLAKRGVGYLQRATSERAQPPPREMPEEPSDETLADTTRARMPFPRRSRTSVGTVLTATARFIGGVLLRLLSGIATGIANGVRWTVDRVRRPGFRSSGRALPYATNRGIARGASWFTRLSPARRRLLLVAIVLILLFAQSVVSLGDRREARKKTEEYEAFLRTANEKVSAADAALLINNESGARRLLVEAQEALGKIPDTRQAPKEGVVTAKTSIEQRLETIRHIVKVDLEPVADLAGLDVGFTASALGLYDDQAYTFNTRNSSVYRIGLEDKKAEVAVASPSLEKPLKGFVNGSGTPLLLQEDGSLVRIGDGGSLATVPIQYENVDRSVVDAVLYNSRLYTLDARNNQVFRHDRSGQGYGLGTSWLSDVETDIRDARSIAIDGAVYVLKGDGAIVKFSGGKKTSVTFDVVDPALSEPLALYTAGDATTLFLLDPKGERVVEFSKDGAFLRQYQSALFVGATDLIAIGETVYVLTGTQVVRFPITK